MSNSFSEEFINDFIDGRLTGEELLRAQRAMNENEIFRDQVETWRGIANQIKALPLKKLPVDFSATVLESIDRPSPKSQYLDRESPTRFSSSTRLWTVLASLAAILTVAFFFIPDSKENAPSLAKRNTQTNAAPDSILSQSKSVQDFAAIEKSEQEVPREGEPGNARHRTEDKPAELAKGQKTEAGESDTLADDSVKELNRDRPNLAGSGIAQNMEAENFPKNKDSGDLKIAADPGLSRDSEPLNDDMNNANEERSQSAQTPSHRFVGNVIAGADKIKINVDEAWLVEVAPTATAQTQLNQIMADNFLLAEDDAEKSKSLQSAEGDVQLFLVTSTPDQMDATLELLSSVTEVKLIEPEKVLEPVAADQLEKSDAQGADANEKAQMLGQSKEGPVIEDAAAYNRQIGRAAQTQQVPKTNAIDSANVAFLGYGQFTNHLGKKNLTEEKPLAIAGSKNAGEELAESQVAGAGAGGGGEPNMAQKAARQAPNVANEFKQLANPEDIASGSLADKKEPGQGLESLKKSLDLDSKVLNAKQQIQQRALQSESSQNANRQASYNFLVVVKNAGVSKSSDSSKLAEPAKDK